MPEGPVVSTSARPTREQSCCKWEEDMLNQTTLSAALLRRGGGVAPLPSCRAGAGSDADHLRAAQPVGDQLLPGVRRHRRRLLRRRRPRGHASRRSTAPARCCRRCPRVRPSSAVPVPVRCSPRAVARRRCGLHLQRRRAHATSASSCRRIREIQTPDDLQGQGDRHRHGRRRRGRLRPQRDVGRRA